MRGIDAFAHMKVVIIGHRGATEFTCILDDWWIAGAKYYSFRQIRMKTA